MKRERRDGLRDVEGKMGVMAICCMLNVRVNPCTAGKSGYVTVISTMYCHGMISNSTHI